MKPTVYVFGGGLVGARIIKALRENVDLPVITNKMAPKGSRIKSTPAAIDLSRIIEDLTVTYGKPDLIINAIGIIGKPSVDWCEDNKHQTRYGNVDIAVDLGWLAIKLGIPYIHISTGCIYNDFKGKVFLPKDEPNFVKSFYSRTKADAEYQLQLIQKEYGGRVEIHRIRIPFSGDNDPRNLFNKLIEYKTLVDSPNSMTHLDDYAKFMVERVTAILENRENDPEEGWMSILHAVNKGALKHSEIIEFLKEVGEIEINPKKYITPQKLNSMCIVPRSNCILGEEQLPDIRTSMFRAIKDYKLNRKTK